MSDETVPSNAIMQPPWYVRVAGALTAVLGVMITIWMPYVGHPSLSRMVGVATVLGGVGLLLGHRWSWPFIVLTAIPFFVVGIIFFLPPEYTDPYELVAPWGVPFLVLGCLLLVGSTTRATRRWLIAS